MPFEGVHPHLAAMIDEYSASLASRKIFDFHMHSGSVAATGDYLRVARRYGVYHACDLTVEADMQAMRDSYGDFFTPCLWPRPDRQSAAELDWGKFRQQWVEGFDGYLRAGARFMKLKTAPWPNQPPSVLPDDEHLDELYELCQTHGLFLQIHAAQPDCWWPRVYDSDVCGDKWLYMDAVEHLLQKHPSLTCVSVHVGSAPEHPDYIDRLMRTYPNYYIDTSATKWMAREISRRASQWRELFISWGDRILFGSDLVVREDMPENYYASRFLVQRLMLESDYSGPSPIIDGDSDDGKDVPVKLSGLHLPDDVLEQIYHRNADRLLRPGVS